MGKLVILKLGEGSLADGFPVILQIGEEDASASHRLSFRPFAEVIGHLPPAPALLNDYRLWQSTYRQLGLRLRLGAPAAQVTNVSLTHDCYQAAQTVSDRLNVWLRADSFRRIRETWLEQLSPQESIRILLQTEDPWMRRLPWHLWDLMERYPQAELALSAPAYQLVPQPPPSSDRVRVLAILGNSQGIDIHADQSVLEHLPHADIHFLAEPDRETLTDYLWAKSWDILFFAGHSSSQPTVAPRSNPVPLHESGCIYINPSDSLTVPQLRYALRKAVDRGLKLALFNSCDGLGLARDLEDLQIPQIIVMREPIPDRVAQAFLKYFLLGYAQGRSLYLAVRDARERLQGLENQFPCATWLPVICQNPAVPPPAWQDFIQPEHDRLSVAPGVVPSQPVRSPTSHTPTLSWRRLAGISALVTSLILGLRGLGGLQASELWTLDQMMRHRPAEPTDPRIVVVTLNPEERLTYGDGTGSRSLSDASFSQLLTILERYQPRVIGLDIYYPYPLDDNNPDRQRVSEQIARLDRFVSICKERYGDSPGIPAMPEVAAPQMGFSDFRLDRDEVLRQQPLVMTPSAASPCLADTSLLSTDIPTRVLPSFSLQLVRQYLHAEQIPVELAPDGTLTLGDRILTDLTSSTGGYQNAAASGRQILLNYRSGSLPIEHISMTQLLHGSIDPSVIRDRIVLIGVTDPTTDTWHTPLTPAGTPKMPGVFVHAHMTSQLLSAVLNDRPLLWTWSDGIELLWIAAWSGVGAVCISQIRTQSGQILAVAIASLSLSGLCWGVFGFFAGWIPWIPALLSLLGTVAIVHLYQTGWHRSHPIFTKRATPPHITSA